MLGGSDWLDLDKQQSCEEPNYCVTAYIMPATDQTHHKSSEETVSQWPNEQTCLGHKDTRYQTVYLHII